MANEALTGEREDRTLWRELDDTEKIEIWCDENGPTEIGAGQAVTKTAREWIEAGFGPGMLCSTEC